MNPDEVIQVCPRDGHHTMGRFCPKCGQVVNWPSRFPMESIRTEVRLRRLLLEEKDINGFLKGLNEYLRALYPRRHKSIYSRELYLETMFLQNVVLWLEQNADQLPQRPADGGALTAVQNMLHANRLVYVDVIGWAVNFQSYIKWYPSFYQRQVEIALDNIISRHWDFRRPSASMLMMNDMDRVIEQLFLWSDDQFNATLRIYDELKAPERAKNQLAAQANKPVPASRWSWLPRFLKNVKFWTWIK